MAVLAIASCGGDSFQDNCEDACINASKCEGSTQNPDDCKAQCDATIALNDKADCDDEANELAECTSSIDSCDSAKLTSECGEKSTAYRKCIADYCIHHEDERCSSAQ